MHSHDPLRYAGDMLAWLHQATASEKEHLESLLKLVNIQGVEDHIREVVGHITEGVCRPLKVRIEQVIISEPGAVLLYKISNLLKFYHHTISAIIGTSGSALLTTIEEMHFLSKKIFFNSLTLHASKLLDKPLFYNAPLCGVYGFIAVLWTDTSISAADLWSSFRVIVGVFIDSLINALLVRSVELPPADLGPSNVLNQTLTLLREVLVSHDSSVVPLDARQADFVQVLSCVLDPLLQMCTVSASTLGTADMATYMVNCLYVMKTTLALFEFTDKRLEMLQFQIDAHLDTLINEQASYVLTRAGLSQIYSCLQQHKPEQGPLSNLPSMDALSLKASMAQFDRYLSASDNLQMPQMNFFLSATVKEQIMKQSTELVCRAYRELYDAVMDPANSYKEPASILHRSPQQVQTLLS
ncbi:conserved oligomeric Golgi complex subunit 6 isoform X2 [Rhinoderma darwinii]|uniref:conserved oligomeric Golgi complex subunit 6 isoform X2 n=1 Tax=Rhinoderma darwinii TaxID=43563 RepID=UPI003F672342